MTTDDPASAAATTAAARISVSELTKVVGATVAVCIPDFYQTRIAGDDGHLYAVVRWTAGVPWYQLQEGQRVRCVVTTNSFPRCVEVLEVL